jgi:uncharacterized protein
MRDAFFIPVDGRHLLYAPLASRLFLMDGQVRKILEDYGEGRQADDGFTQRIIDYFRNEGLFTAPEQHAAGGGGGEFLPTTAILFPTFDCNLRCVYCYSNGGDTKTQMDVVVAKKAVDFIVENALKVESKGFRVHFGGGGEPTLPWDVFTGIVDYSRESGRMNGLEPSFFLLTNGVLLDQQVEWIIENLSPADNVVSFDGPREIHDAQRPMACGKGSFDRVCRTLGQFRDSGYDYRLRTTITASSVGRMLEIVDFIHERLSPKAVYFEPVFPYPRAVEKRCSPPEPGEFARQLLKAMDLAEDYSMRLSYASCSLDRVSEYFCGAVGDNFVVTPDGFVSSCYEVSSRDDPRSDTFFIGKYDPAAGGFVFDAEKRRKLSSRSSYNIPKCRECLAKFNCAGGCLAKVLWTTDDLYDVVDDRCVITRQVLKSLLLKRFEPGTDGVLKVNASDDQIIC